jgi:hypothetical protein
MRTIILNLVKLHTLVKEFMKIIQDVDFSRIQIKVDTATIANRESFLKDIS